MKRLAGILLAWLKWTILALVLVEIGCFLLITLGNQIMFGSIWKGSQVRYDPYAEFLNLKGVQPTAHNPAGREGEKPNISGCWGDPRPAAKESPMTSR